MSQNGVANVFKGLWVNWSRGTILGSTLTLSDRDGALLIAFLAIFVSAAGGALWRIISYTIHQSRAKLAYQDGLHHQQQVIFRNASTPGGASWQLLQLLFHWWDYAKYSVLRIVPLAALAFVNLVLFALAGVFSAEVTKAAGNEVLVRSPKCGTWGISSNSTPQQQAAFRSKTLLDSTSASTYARSCYGQAQDPLACTQYTRPNIHGLLARTSHVRSVVICASLETLLPIKWTLATLIPIKYWESMPLQQIGLLTGRSLLARLSKPKDTHLNGTIPIQVLQLMATPTTRYFSGNFQVLPTSRTNTMSTHYLKGRAINFRIVPLSSMFCNLFANCAHSDLYMPLPGRAMPGYLSRSLTEQMQMCRFFSWLRTLSLMTPLSPTRFSVPILNNLSQPLKLVPIPLPTQPTNTSQPLAALTSTNSAIHPLTNVRH